MAGTAMLVRLKPCGGELVSGSCCCGCGDLLWLCRHSAGTHSARRQSCTAEGLVPCRQEAAGKPGSPPRQPPYERSPLPPHLLLSARGSHLPRGAALPAWQHVRRRKRRAAEVGHAAPTLRSPALHGCQLQVYPPRSCLLLPLLIFVAIAYTPPSAESWAGTTATITCRAKRRRAPEPAARAKSRAARAKPSPSLEAAGGPAGEAAGVAAAGGAEAGVACASLPPSPRPQQQANPRRRRCASRRPIPPPSRQPSLPTALSPSSAFKARASRREAGHAPLHATVCPSLLILSWLHVWT